MLFNKSGCQKCGCPKFDGNRQGMMGMYGGAQMPASNTCGCNEQVMEPAITNCVEQNCYHQVEHIIPIHTHVINRDIYQHSYVPAYSCSQENQVVNIDPCKCGNNF